jgi:uncharacterized short protein YbdD (DUF466 family)
MITTIIIDLAGLFVIGSSIYDMYVNYKIKKYNEEICKANKNFEDEIKQWKESKKENI